MNEPTSASTAATAGTGSTMTEPAASPYDAPPTWTPGGPPPTYAGPAAPATPAPGFGDRVFKLWHALVVAAACLIVGLGFGVLIGHETASGSGSDGFRPPGIGQGPGGQGTDGQGLGRGPGGQGNGQGLGPGFGQGFGQGQSGSGSGTSGGTSS